MVYLKTIEISPFSYDKQAFKLRKFDQKTI